MMWKWDRKWRTSVEIWWQSSDWRQFTIWSRGTQWVIDYGANPVLHLIWLNFPLIGYINWLFLCTGQLQPLCQVAATDWFVQTWKCLRWEKQPWLVQKMEGIVAGTEPCVSGACMCRYQVQPPSLLLFPLSPFPANCHRFRQLTSTNWKLTGISSLFDDMFCASVSCSNLFFGSWVPYQDLLIWNGQCKPPLFVVLYGSNKKLINQLAPFQASLSSTEENGLKLICWLILGGKCSCFFKHAVALSIDQHWVFTSELSLDPPHTILILWLNSRFPSHNALYCVLWPCHPCDHGVINWKVHGVGESVAQRLLGCVLRQATSPKCSGTFCVPLLQDHTSTETSPYSSNHT